MLATTRTFDPSVSSSTGDAELATVQSDAPAVTPVTIQPGSSATLTVTFAPTASDGRSVAGDLFVVDDVASAPGVQRARRDPVFLQGRLGVPKTARPALGDFRSSLGEQQPRRYRTALLVRTSSGTPLDSPHCGGSRSARTSPRPRSARAVGLATGRAFVGSRLTDCGLSLTSGASEVRAWGGQWAPGCGRADSSQVESGAAQRGCGDCRDVRPPRWRLSSADRTLVIQVDAIARSARVPSRVPGPGAPREADALRRSCSGYRLPAHEGGHHRGRTTTGSRPPACWRGTESRRDNPREASDFASTFFHRGLSQRCVRYTEPACTPFSVAAATRLVEAVLAPAGYRLVEQSARVRG